MLSPSRAEPASLPGQNKTLYGELMKLKTKRAESKVPSPAHTPARTHTHIYIYITQHIYNMCTERTRVCIVTRTGTLEVAGMAADHAGALQDAKEQAGLTKQIGTLERMIAKDSSMQVSVHVSHRGRLWLPYTSNRVWARRRRARRRRCKRILQPPGSERCARLTLR